MKKLAFGGASSQHFGRILRCVPQPDEQINLADVFLFPIWEADLISYEAIFMQKIIDDSTDLHTLAVKKIDAGLRAQVSAVDFSGRTFDRFRSFKRMENGNQTSTK